MMRRMSMEERKNSGAGHRPAMFAALWTLIAVTLLSALAPLGPPLTGVKGSAFNPATTDVVLKSRAAARPSAPVAPRLDSDGLPPACMVVLTALVLLGAGLTRRADAVFFSAFAAPRSCRRRARRARAPPAAA